MSKYEADWNTSPLDWMEQIDAMRQRAETAERQKREWVDEWRKACKRAQEAELERDTLRALRGEFAEYRQVDAMDRKTSEARIAQLEAALRRIAEKRGVAKEDAKRYLEGACDIADDALRPAVPPSQKENDVDEQTLLVLGRFLDELKRAADFAQQCDSIGVERYVAVMDVYEALRNAIGKADHGKGGGT